MEADHRSTTASLPTVTWEMLEKSLAHPNPLIREKAIEMAGRFEDLRALAVLQSAVRDDNPRIRAAAAQAFVQAALRRNPTVDAALAQIITSASDDELRSFLLSNALTSGSEILLRAAIACLVDPAASIRTAAENVLSREGGAWLVTQAAADTMPVIEGARNAFNAEVSAAAARWCEQLQRAQMRRTMLDSGLAAVLTLTGALHSANAVVRAGAVAALRQAGDARALTALADALNDINEEVRRAAALALGELKWRPSGDEELARWFVAIQRWPAAVAQGSHAVDALLRAAEYSSPPVQAAAIESLAQLKSVRALPPLVSLLTSSSALVRRAAAQALKVLEWVPASSDQAISQAIELEDWPAAAAFGAEAVRPLMSAFKDSHDRPERCAAIVSALSIVTDPKAGDELLPFCRDGEVARGAVMALDLLLERSAGEISVATLQGVAELKNVVQFKFSVDPKYKRAVRAGMEFVNVDLLRARAMAELECRQAEASADAAPANGVEAA